MKTSATGARLYEEIEELYFTGSGGFSEEETPEPSKIRASMMSKPQRVAVFLFIICLIPSWYNVNTHNMDFSE